MISPSRIATALIFLLCMASSVFAAEVSKITANDVMKYIGANKGRIVIINFWATWCGPCRQEFPGLVSLRSEVPENELAILSVSLDTSVKPVERFIDAQKANFPVYIDAGDVGPTFSLSSIPRTLIFDDQGKKVIDHLGYISLDDFHHVLKKLKK